MEFGPMHLWQSMGFIAKAVVVILVLLSIYSLYISVERVLYYRKARKQSLEFVKKSSALMRQNQFQQAIDTARAYPQSHLSQVVVAGLLQFQNEISSRRISSDAVESAKRAIERSALFTLSELKRGTGSLATIATTAPFVGLFGTVVGIINAFRGMATTGSGGIGAVSAGIAEALVTTALGLFVAIPAAWMYNYFTNELEYFQIEMNNSSSELLDYFIKHVASHDERK